MNDALPESIPRRLEATPGKAPPSSARHVVQDGSRPASWRVAHAEAGAPYRERAPLPAKTCACAWTGRLTTDPATPAPQRPLGFRTAEIGQSSNRKIRGRENIKEVG
jgi:hypothetical protein